MAAELKRSDLARGIRAEVEALLRSIGEGMIVTDSQARISRINKSALNILGFSESELLGKWFPDAIVAEDSNGARMDSLDRPIGQAFLSGQSVTSRTFYRRKDGSRIPVSLTVSPVMLDGRPVGAIEVFRDISRELSLEQAKDEFVAIASHQLRTPATAVKQYIGLLLEGYAEPITDGQRLFLERAYESNERQLHIVEEILKITQLDLEKINLNPVEYDVREIVREALASLASNFENKQQKIKLIQPSKPVLAKVDVEQLRIAVENLLENASNYTWDNQKITIKVSQRTERVYIAITDEGVGIDETDIPLLFQKFSRIPNPLSVEIGGTGLGLYWARKIIDMHGGRIGVKSRLGEGTTFTISLPR